MIELRGALDIEALSGALDRVIRRHDSLRATFRFIGFEPRQIIKDAASFKLPVDDLRLAPVESRFKAAFDLTERLVRQPIDLREGPIFNARLIRLGEACFRLIMTCHHIAFDGLSANVLVRELTDGYAAETGRAYPAQPLSIQYADLVRRQRSPEARAMEDRELDWWTKRLAGAPPLLALPTDRPRPPVQSFAGHSVPFALNEDLHESAQRLARNHRVTSFVVYLAALTIVLYRWTGQQDLVVSSGVSTRRSRLAEGLIGCFINIILLRIGVLGDMPCSELIRQVGRTAREAFSHQDLPFERLVQSLSPERDLSHNPLAQVMIVYHNDGAAVPDFPGVEAKRVMPEKMIAQYDLLVHLIPAGESMTGRFEYNTDLFDKATITRLSEQFTCVLEAMASRPSTRVGSLNLLPPNQLAEILAHNAAPSPFPDDRCIHTFFEGWATRQPDAPAVISSGDTLTYRKLNLKADSLARTLLERGVQWGGVIAVSLDRSPNLVAALLAISKIGAAYVPIDADYPAHRIRYILSDSKAVLLVTESHFSPTIIDDLNLKQVLYIDREDCQDSDYSSGRVQSNGVPGDLLCLIYTSGSTGAPKGAMLDHRGRVNNFHDFNQRFGIGPGDRLLAVSSPSFDMCAYDVFGILMAGATIVLPASGAALTPDEWSDLISRHDITIWHSAPALLEPLLDHFDRGAVPSAPSLRLALLGGDWIPLSMPERLRRYATSGVTVVSLGGATEVSMDSTIYLVGDQDANWSSIPYGVAMANQTVYVLDDLMQLAPIGVAGELYIGGVGVGWGYFDRPGLTASRFVPCPHPRTPGERIYRTGDVARWTNAGVLELLGRTDFQVKINGVRIELGEIDAALTALGCVKASVTSLYRPASGSPRLVSYIVPDEGGFDWEGVRETLFGQLPAYMIPRQCVVLDRLPLSPNGKVLRKGLPAPEVEAVAEPASVAPRTVAEKTLHTLWASALGHEDFGIDHDFFDLGGTSLQAASIVNRSPRRLSMLDFLRHSTVRGQARALTADGGPSQSRIFRFPTSGRRRLTLLCVPYAGGSAISFRGLADALPDEVATAVVCMPCLGDDDADVTLERIADLCVQDLLPHELSDMAVYGHCAGVGLASELVRRLHARGHAIRGWFLAAALPLGVPSPFTKPRQSDQEIIDFVAALGGAHETDEAEDWAVMAREFRRDSRLVREHVARLQITVPEPLARPLDVIFGSDDPLTRGNEACFQLWDRLSTDVRRHEIPGNHYFVSANPVDVARIIAERLGILGVTGHSSTRSSEVPPR